MFSRKAVSGSPSACGSAVSRQRTLEQPFAVLEDVPACNRLSLQLVETVAAGIRIGPPRSWSASILCWIKMCRKWTSLLYLPCTWPCKCGQSYLVSTNHWSISHEPMNPCYAILWSILSRLGLETSGKTCFPPYIFTIFHAMQDLVEIRPAGRSHSASDGGEVPTIQRAERVTLGCPPMRRHLFPKKHMLDGKWSSNFPQVTNPHCKLKWSIRSIWGAPDTRCGKKQWNRLTVQILQPLFGTLV